MNEDSRKEFFFTIAALSFTLLATLVSLTRCWEPSGESWGYWYFARVFAESGKFIVIDRSPLYILYLNLFMYFPYPYSVIAEFVVTTSVAVLALIFFARRYLGDFLGIFAGILWLPFMQSAEPPVQKLALACCLLAVIIRSKSGERSHIMLSYAFMTLAYLFRQTYVIVIFSFLLYDFISLILTRSIVQILALIRPRLLSDWPLIFSIGVLVVFLVNQSTHPWNNVWFGSTQWFPSDGKTMADGGGLQALNWAYIFDRYGSFYGHDWYFTNIEAFGGAKSFIGAIRVNPEFFSKYLTSNIKEVVGLATMGLPPQRYLPYETSIGFIVHSISLIGILLGAFFGAKDRTSQIFIFSCLAMMMTTALSIPRGRYFFPFIPILVISASFFGKRLSIILERKCVSHAMNSFCTKN